MKNTLIQLMNRKLALTLLAVIPLITVAQLSITTNTVATTLAQTIVGSGVSVGNANLKCGVHASGTFTDTGSDLGLNNGVILTTGYATDAGGPAVFANYDENSHGVPTYSDPALMGIGGAQAKYDVCILTFTFVPVCSSLSIQYVFGSEEYPKYINSYNDAFGIFLSGVNPSGGNYFLTNIATLPNGHNTPVSIDSVNGGYTTAEGATTGANAPIAASNPTYYVNNYSNSGSGTSPGANGDISYHGYTTPITSVASVNPCQTYTLEIAIADGGNGNYDSGVFIQAGSISCSSTPIYSTTPDNCNSSNGTATILNAPSNATYSWSPGGQSTSSISGLVNGSYTCVVNIPATSCTSASSIPVVVTVPSVSVAPAGNVTASATQNTCGNNDGSATITITGLVGTSSYIWIPGGQTTSSISGLAAGIYTCGVNISNCNDTIHNIVTTTVTTIAPPTPSITSSAIAPNCTDNSGSAFITVTNTTATPTYSWSNGQTTSSISGVSAGTYSCTVSIPNCPSATHSMVVVVVPTGTNVVSASFSLSPTTGNAPLTVTVTNASAGASTYTWTFGNGTTSNLQDPSTIIYNTQGTYSVILYASQGAGCTVMETETVVVSEPANIIVPNIFTPNGDEINDLFTITGFGITNFDCIIYDRWGLEMFESTSVTNSWDGKNKKSAAVPDGIYFYIIKATDINLKGNTYKGFVTLIR